MYRQLHFAVCRCVSWDSHMIIDNKVNKELQFWSDNIMNLTFQPLFKTDSDPEIIIYTDASTFACAGYCVQFSNTFTHNM